VFSCEGAHYNGRIDPGNGMRWHSAARYALPVLH